MASPLDESSAGAFSFPGTEKEFHTCLESIPDAVVIVDADGKIAVVNQQTEALFGYSRQELLGRPVEILLPAQHRARHVTHRTEYAHHPRVRPMGAGLELRGVRRDGTQFPVEISLSPIEGIKGMSVFGTIRDVTRAKQIEDQLRQARNQLEIRVQERTAELAHAVHDLETEIAQHQQAEAELARERDRAQRYLDVVEVALVALDSSGNVSMINRKGLRMLGYRENELVGRNWFSTCLPKQYREQARRTFHQLLEEQTIEYFENPVITREGEERLVAWHNTVLRDRAGKVIGSLSSGEDITERRQAEEAVRQLAAIVESSEDAIVGKTLDGTIVSWNAGAERLFGYSASEAIGQPITLLAPPERMTEMAEILTRVKRGDRVQRMETVRVTKDGRRIDVALTVSPVRDDRGDPIAAATIARDITERAKLEQQLRQAHKMEAIGRLAGGIAHDFNNLLGVILGDCELLLADRGMNPSERKSVEEIREAGERASALTRQLLAFSRQQTLETKVVDLNAVMTGFENILRRLAGPEIAFDLVLGPNLGTTRADPNQLLQVILNLVVNARDAMPRGGNLRIEVSSVMLDEGNATSNPGGKPGRHVQITVADTGPGMDRETLARIFEPFFTTKEHGKGAGLGLATAYGIVQQLGGCIWAHSEPGNGSTFKIFLPQINETASDGSEAQSDETLPRGTETLLLVEDASLLRRVTQEFLERIGYAVLAAEDGPDAMAISSRYNGEIHLLLTDLAMPGMNGQELAVRLLEERPSMKVLYTSGYAESILAERQLSGPDAPFIEKPFSWQNLARKVRGTLDAH
jgi:two-component system cell cycle sensor histidine kinase/response regulator CckA